MNVHKTTHQQSFWRESRPGRASTLCPMLAKYSFVGAEKLSAMSCHYPPELLSNWYNVSHREASARFCQMDVLSLPGTHQNCSPIDSTQAVLSAAWISPWQSWDGLSALGTDSGTSG